MITPARGSKVSARSSFSRGGRFALILAQVQEYPEFGMEAIGKIEVEDFPAFIVIDDKGNDFFKELNLG